MKTVWVTLWTRGVLAILGVLAIDGILLCSGAIHNFSSWAFVALNIGFYLWHNYGMPWVRHNVRTNKQYVELAIGALLIYFVLRFIPHFGDISIAFLAVYGFAIIDLAFWPKDNNQETKK